MYEENVFRCDGRFGMRIDKLERLDRNGKRLLCRRYTILYMHGEIMPDQLQHARLQQLRHNGVQRLYKSTVEHL
jgi:hypothetical protein